MPAKRAKEQSPKWHAEDIKAAIRKRGMTLSRLAEKNDLHESACRAALIRSQPEAEKVISQFLAIPLHELWPDRYDESGGRIRHVRDETSQEIAATHRLTRQAV